MARKIFSALGALLLLMAAGSAQAVQKDKLLYPGDQACVPLDATEEVNALVNVIQAPGAQERVSYQLTNTNGVIFAGETSAFVNFNIRRTMTPQRFPLYPYPTRFRLCAFNNISWQPIQVQVILNGF